MRVLLTISILVLVAQISVAVGFAEDNIDSDLVITVSTDKSEYVLGESIEIHITAHNLTGDEMCLHFWTLCQSEYYIDGFYSGSYHGCYQMESEVTIPADSSHTWDWIHTADIYLVPEGPHDVIGEVIGYGLSVPISITVLDPSGIEDNLVLGFPGPRLHQNYPNPFRSSTTITYDLPCAASVVLSIFDVHGREIAKLAAQRRSLGRCTVDFDARNLPGGIYFCRMTTGDLTETKRMSLVE